MARPKRNQSAVKPQPKLQPSIVPVVSNELPKLAQESEQPQQANIAQPQQPINQNVVILPAQNPNPLPPMVNVPNPNQQQQIVLDDQFLVNVDYITTPSGVPITKERITRTELYQAGVNINNLLATDSITFFGRVEVQNVQS